MVLAVTSVNAIHSGDSGDHYTEHSSVEVHSSMSSLSPLAKGNSILYA